MTLRKRFRPRKKPRDDDAELSEMEALRRELVRLNNSKAMRLHSSWLRILFFNFVRGLMVGLGTVIGASILLSFVVWSLSQIEFLPIIGDYATKIIDEVESSRAISNSSGTD